MNIGRLERVAYQKARRAVVKNRKGKIVFILVFVLALAIIGGFFIYNSYSKNEEPSEEYVVLKEIIENNENYVMRVIDENILAELVKLFTKTFGEMVEDLPDFEDAS